EFMVRHLVDIAEDELDVPDVAGARVRPGVRQLRAVEVHPHDPRAGVCRGEREPPLSRADIQHDLSAKVLVPKLFHQHRTEGVGLFRRLPPRQRAALARVAAAARDGVNGAVEPARAAFDSADWRDLDPSKRGRLLRLLGQQVRDHFDEVSRLESQNVGKPLREAKGDIAYVYKLFEYYA